MKRFLLSLFLLFFLFSPSLFSQPRDWGNSGSVRIRWSDATTEFRDSVRAAIADSVRSIAPDSIAIYVSDSTAFLSDSLSKQRSAIDSLKGLVNSSFNFYDRQDASVNSALQMHVRWAHYWFQKYYTDLDTTMTFDYDGSDSIYIGTRRQLGAYMNTLRYLHNISGDSRYWNLLVELMNKMDGQRVKLAEKGGGVGSDTSYYYLMHSNTGWNPWSFDDCRLYLIKLYMYQQDPVTYATYLDEIKSFANVALSYMDSSAAYPGWGWAYGYTGDRSGLAAGDAIVNPSGPFLPFYATLRANNITLSERVTSVAQYDTLLDSVYAYIDGVWFNTEANLRGGWGYDYADVSPDVNYTYVVLQDLYETTEILNDTTWADSLTRRLRMGTNYAQNPTGTWYAELNTYYPPRQGIMNLWANKYGFAFVSDSMAQSHMANWLRQAPYTGSNLAGMVLNGGPRRMGGNYLIATTTALAYFNNSDLSSKTWNHFVKKAGTTTGWATDATTYYMGDGSLFYQKFRVGTTKTGTAVGIIGFEHTDTTPQGGNPDTTTIDADNIIQWRVPQSGNMVNGLNYSVKHRLGTPFFHVTPSVADTFHIFVDDPGDNQGDSLYFFYYNMAGFLDTLKNTTLPDGDSIQVNLKKGMMIQIARTTSAVVGYQSILVAANHAAAWIVADRDNGSNKLYRLSKTTPVDSAMFGIAHHKQGNWFLDNPVATVGWGFTFAAAEDMLNAVRKFWEAGLRYDGILEDKTQ